MREQYIRQSKRNRPVEFYLEIYACLAALIQTLKTSIMKTSFHCWLLRIFGCTPLAAYTVQLRQLEL